MNNLFDIHVHTLESSSCGMTAAADIVKRYREFGYDGICITDHMNKYNFERFEGGHKEKTDAFLAGYKAAKEAAGADFKVILGMEIRFLDCSNDYLVFGFDESFLYEHSLHTFGSIREFDPFKKEHNLTLFQAHPFRRDMKIISPDYLDGMEVYNGHGGHDSANEIAYMWAEKYGMRMSSASDFHYDTGKEPGGMYFVKTPADSFEMARLLINGEYTLKTVEKG